MVTTAPEDTPAKPAMTFPGEEAAWVREHYAAATAILEYGSGGSTALAAEMPGKTVFSVESDAGWVEMMQRYFDAHPPAARLHLLHADIGPTGKWGRPKSVQEWPKYHRYATEVWARKDFVEPDLVLIDGRFRPACFATTALLTEKPVTVLFDDYANRAVYHQVEHFARPVELRGRMAKFLLEPRPLSRRDFLFVQSLFAIVK